VCFRDPFCFIMHKEFCWQLPGRSSLHVTQSAFEIKYIHHYRQFAELMVRSPFQHHQPIFQATPPLFWKPGCCFGLVFPGLVCICLLSRMGFPYIQEYEGYLRVFFCDLPPPFNFIGIDPVCDTASLQDNRFSPHIT